MASWALTGGHIHDQLVAGASCAERLFAAAPVVALVTLDQLDTFHGDTPRRAFTQSALHVASLRRGHVKPIT